MYGTAGTESVLQSIDDGYDAAPAFGSFHSYCLSAAADPSGEGSGHCMVSNPPSRDRGTTMLQGHFTSRAPIRLPDAHLIARSRIARPMPGDYLDRPVDQTYWLWYVGAFRRPYSARHGGRLNADSRPNGDGLIS